MRSWVYGQFNIALIIHLSTQGIWLLKTEKEFEEIKGKEQHFRTIQADDK